MSNIEVEVSSADRLLERIRTHEALVGVVGLGYVGLPFAVEKAKVGFRVVGIEQNPARAAKVNGGESYIGDVRQEELARLVEAGTLSAQSGFDRVTEMDVVVICVPTPLTRNLTPDLSYVESVTAEIGQRLKSGQLVSLESTTYPGTTEEVMVPILERASGLVADRDFFVAHSPERVDPGNERYTTKNTSKVVGGVGPRSLEVAQAFYEQTIEHVVPVSSAKAAELVKVFENTFRAVNIALVNELAMLCDGLGLNVWEVLDAAFTKPFGIMAFYPGPGVGGHCIPIDPHYLEWKAREFDFSTHFIALAGEVNRRMPHFVREKVVRALNGARKPVSGSRVLFLGAAYKKDLDDTRESPALEVMELVAADGGEVVFHDPWSSEIEVAGRKLESQPLDEALLRSADLVVVTTDHTNVDYDLVLERAALILDTRNVFGRRGRTGPNVILL